MSAPRIYWIVSHLSAKNYQNWWKFDEVLTKTNLLSFFGEHGVYCYCTDVRESCEGEQITSIAFVKL